MSYSRSLSATLLCAVTTFGLLLAFGCDTNAVGVDECRDIERARCRASAACGVIDDVPACERYYRDHCLHGLATKPPSSAVVGACVEVIQRAGRCASEDPDAPLKDCEEKVSEAYWTVKTACDVVAHPELTTECAFLTDTPPEGTGGQGGQASTEGGAGQTADGGTAPE